MQPVPYLTFNGTCEAAMRAYADIFGAPEPQIMYSGEAPPEHRMGDAKTVMHSAVKVGDGWIFATDYGDGTPTSGLAVAITSKDADETRRLFAALAEGGTVEMEVAATFWSPGFGSLKDRWGTRWMLDTEGVAMPDGTTAAPAEASS